MTLNDLNPNSEPTMTKPVEATSTTFGALPIGSTFVFGYGPWGRRPGTHAPFLKHTARSYRDDKGKVWRTGAKTAVFRAQDAGLGLTLITPETL